MPFVNAFNASLWSPLTGPVQSLVAWLTRPSNTPTLVPPANAPLAYQRLTFPAASRGSIGRWQPVRPASSFRAAPSSPVAPTRSRLRVVREHPAAGGPACAGRMVISGRMIEVCAELERMTQREASGF
jgi:hypothetical protein